LGFKGLNYIDCGNIWKMLGKAEDKKIRKSEDQKFGRRR
jgi:hypothetical protein